MNSQENRIKNLQEIIDVQNELLESNKEFIKTYEEVVNNSENVIKNNHDILCSIGKSYNDVITRFPTELAEKFKELENKTDDILYVFEFKKTYSSIINDLTDLQELINKVIFNSFENQKDR